MSGTDPISKTRGCAGSPASRPAPPRLNRAAISHPGKPTRIANSDRDVRQPAGSLPVTESMLERIYGIPWFKHYRPQIIEEHALAFRKVAEHADELLGSPSRPELV